MSALSAAASDEDSDIIRSLQARIRELEAMLYAVGAGGVGKVEQPQVEQEPVAWMFHAGDVWKFRWHHFNRPTGDDALKHWKPLYAHQQPRQPLTDDAIADLMMRTWGCASIAPRHAPTFARAIERAHGIGGDV